MLSDVAFRELHKRIRCIPHLDTGIRFDAEKLRAEWNALPSTMIRPYDSKSKQREMAEIVNTMWHGASFTSTNGETFGNMNETTLEPKQTVKTPLCDMLPYMTECIFSLGKGTLSNVNRLMVMKPGGHLTWHSHWFDYDKMSTSGRIVLQIPIIMPPKFEYEVINIREWKFGDHGRGFPKIHTATYPEGHLYHFDSYNVHNVHNRDTYDRVTIMMYVDMTDDYIAQMLDQAERNYDGIRLSEK